jgi:hypothetical protein
MGKMFKTICPLKPVSQFKAIKQTWHKWSTFKIISSDSNLHPRWPPSADIVLTNDPMGNMFKNLLL